ncbi:50S ribosomal protein L11 methyltransferase [Desulfosarcina sp. OttesenSCG-928-A07]|nr:50S ribosomal protein L11 methyltransferase [Desulfosarcina sp. OttesenSCG-928-A07]
MKWIAATVTFDSPDRALATDLIADIFYSLNLKGVVIDDPDMDPAADWGENALLPPEKPGVTGYFPDTDGSMEKCRFLESAVADLSDALSLDSIEISYARIDEADWAEAWKAYFWPEQITDRIVVKPTWRDYEARPGEMVIEIDPGMAFGTGGHATTALCIHLIQAHLLPGNTFLDVGTGSGILMIAAEKLGAGNLFGVDNDPVAIGVAEKNMKVNGIDRFQLFTGNLVDIIAEPMDMVAANILAEVILTLIPSLDRVLKKGGIFICSGIIQEKQEMVCEALTAAGFSIVKILEQDGWVAVSAKQAEKSDGFL